MNREEFMIKSLYTIISEHMIIYMRYLNFYVMGRDVPSIRFEWMSRFVMPTPVRLQRSDLSTSGWKMENMETAEVRGVIALIRG